MNNSQEKPQLGAEEIIDFVENRDMSVGELRDEIQKKVGKFTVNELGEKAFEIVKKLKKSKTKKQEKEFQEVNEFVENVKELDLNKEGLQEVNGKEFYVLNGEAYNLLKSDDSGKMLSLYNPQKREYLLHIKYNEEQTSLTTSIKGVKNFENTEKSGYFFIEFEDGMKCLKVGENGINMSEMYPRIEGIKILGNTILLNILGGKYFGLDDKFQESVMIYNVDSFDSFEYYEASKKYILVSNVYGEETYDLYDADTLERIFFDKQIKFNRDKGVIKYREENELFYKKLKL